MKTSRLNRMWVLAIGAMLLASCGGATKVADAANAGTVVANVEAQSTVPQP
ncbi:MAG: hypothetical protein ACKO67_01280 [Bacteroidota bacterium]